MSSPLRLIQVVATGSSRKAQILPIRYNLQISCRVKPNASGGREGITAVGTEQVNVSVAAAPRDGEANAAVSRVFAKLFGVAKSDVGVIHGLKSRDKVLSIADLDIGSEIQDNYLGRIAQQLQDAIIKK